LDLTGFDGAGRRKRMGEMLMEADVLTQAQLDRALSIQKEQPQRRLGSILIELGYTEGDVIAQVLGCQAKVPFVRLETDEPDPAAVRLVSERLASHHICIPLRLEDDRLLLAMANPMDLIAIQDIEHATGLGVDPSAASADSITKAIKAYYGVEGH
jgi:type IV pilus assembly protein PilB